MENPFSWTEAERVIHKALIEHSEAKNRGVCGASAAMHIANALRAENLLPAYEQPPAPEKKAWEEPPLF